MNNKVRKVLYFIKGFLKNPHILIPQKSMIFSAVVIGQVLYFASTIWIKKTKERARSTEDVHRTLVNMRFYSIEGFISKWE